MLSPADKNLAGAAVELVTAENREYKLQAALKALPDKYNFIILDCPPALDLLTLNALVAANAVLVPIQCEYLALEGVSELLDTLMRIRRTLNPSLEIEGILLTMYDERTTLSRQVATDLRSFFGTQIFQSVIPRNVRLAEAPSFGKPIILYDIHSKGAEGYTQLAQEVIVNAEKRTGTGGSERSFGSLSQRISPNPLPFSRKQQQLVAPPWCPRGKPSTRDRENWISISLSLAHTNQERAFEKRRWMSWRVRFGPAASFNRWSCGRLARDFS